MATTGQEDSQRRNRRNGRMLGKLLLAAVLMFGFGYSLVPLYEKICEITGINVLAVQETVNVKPSNTQIDASRTITVECEQSDGSAGDSELCPARVGRVFPENGMLLLQAANAGTE
jgi:cytochrome c oxidase assembly protein Cox11